jgi:hypothetical protein
MLAKGPALLNHLTTMAISNDARHYSIGRNGPP